SCVKSLYAQFSEKFEDNTIELTIVDNASGDESVEVLNKTIHQEKYKNIRVLANSENVGFSKGSLVTIISGTKASEVIAVLKKIPIGIREKVLEVTLDMSNAMGTTTSQ
ncbi:glycosyltransferase, partial [Patescibacteria group bacterium]|nr:glycosyltransferase [Patescibacteria group bacterium]